MRIKFIEVSNFRKLKSTRIDFGEKTTIFVGANNSGKTSAMIALRYFLLSPSRLALRDITLANWTKIDQLGNAWENNTETDITLDALLPALDVWLDVPLSEIRYVAHILPKLDWEGGLLGVRLQYSTNDIDKLKRDYLDQWKAASNAHIKDQNGGTVKIQIWPKSLTDYLERQLQKHIDIKAFVLDPPSVKEPIKGYALPQTLPATALPLDKDPFKHLIRIDEIAAQRDLADAGGRSPSSEDTSEQSVRRFKRRLSDQLRSYYDRHLDPSKTPTTEDYEALGAIQTAESSFDTRLKAGFSAAFAELQNLGYPGITNPKLCIATQLRATDGLNHNSAVQYQVADPTGDGTKGLMLPENYAGLGYQNLIAMVFMLMGFRDDWMRVGKVSLRHEHVAQHQIQPLHLVLVEEPEAHLHAQVQQVFINKAYDLLRNHSDLGDKDTFSTQLIVSTHSSHIAHEADFSNLRYFRRCPARSTGDTPTTTVANLTHIFGKGDDTKRFVSRYLKATHCDLFFADGIIFVEGQAERILVPHFIRHHFQELSRRYITVLDLGGSHAHRFRELVDELGLATLIIADLDATAKTEVMRKDGTPTNPWKAVRPKTGTNQETANQVLKNWHPALKSIDDLIALDPEKHALPACDGHSLYVAYQKPISVDDDSEIISRTFEDALIHENREVLSKIEGSKTSDKIKEIVKSGLTDDELEDALFDLLKSADKAAFALDCFMMEDPKSLKPPQYIRLGLEWLQRAVGIEIADSEPKAVKA